MTDVRLTATNPEDSSVVPVACNAKGELLLEEIPDQSFDGNLDGDLTVSGSAVFSGNITKELANGASSCIIGDEFLRIYDNSTSNTDAKISLDNDGSADFAGNIDVNGGINGAGATIFADGRIYGKTLYAQGGVGNGIIFQGLGSAANTVITFETNGDAIFTGDVIVGSRYKSWMLVEQNGLCHMVEQLSATTADLVKPVAAEYPPLRDVFAELDAIEKALGEVMDKLRMAPPAGWEVWDGSSENS